MAINIMESDYDVMDKATKNSFEVLFMPYEMAILALERVLWKENRFL
jgi:hypothetical protein